MSLSSPKWANMGLFRHLSMTSSCGLSGEKYRQAASKIQAFIRAPVSSFVKPIIYRASIGDVSGKSDR
jgi:hypothetical protein